MAEPVWGSDSLRKVSAALKISADYLLTGQNGAGKYPELLSLLEGLSDHQLKMAHQVLQCMVRFHGDTE